MRSRAVGLIAVLELVGAGAALGPSLSVSRSLGATPVATSPIRHVVVIFQENHSFDNVLGGLCVRDELSCDGTTTGLLDNGTRVPLGVAPDIVPQVTHSTSAQSAAIDLGSMDGFDRITGCGPPTYKCYSQYGASEIPNLRKLAEAYVISDRTFSESPVPSWGGHMDLIAGQLGGFLGDNPVPNPNVSPKPGWGCDSRRDTPWHDPSNPFPGYLMVPACIPRADGFGPYRQSPVQHIPTILDRLGQAGLSWKLYSDVAPTDAGYMWSICPTFASCLYDPHNHNMSSPNWVARARFASDATAGRLPSYSVILPGYDVSQHNGTSMQAGDNYIAGLVSAVMNGPSAQWQSTAIFITYDDCGCFYDHVAPPPGTGLGIRVPMVIVSPEAKESFVDHTQASFDSILAFVEQNYGLAPLSRGDANAYDYCHSFVFTNLDCTGSASATPNTSRRAPAQITLEPSPVPDASTQYVKTHPPDPNDPT